MDVCITGIVQYLIEHVTIKLGRFVKKDVIIGVWKITYYQRLELKTLIKNVIVSQMWILNAEWMKT